MHTGGIFYNREIKIKYLQPHEGFLQNLLQNILNGEMLKLISCNQNKTEILTVKSIKYIGYPS